MAPAAGRFSRSHSRSSSLPCLVHPLISHLEMAIHAARTWLAHSDRDPAPATALRLVGELISTVDQVFNLPESRDPFSSSAAADQLLDDLLTLADAYGSVRSAAIALKQNHGEMHSAIRRRDGLGLAAAVKNQRQIEREISQLASTVRHMRSSATASGDRCGAEVGIGGIVREAVSVAAVVSVEALAKVVSASSAAAAAASGAVAAAGSGRVSLFKKRHTEEAKEAAAVRGLDALEECITDLESGSESAFRSLVRARVSLLNVVSLSF